MNTSQAEATGNRSEKRMLFTDTEPYIIPAQENWNEGYSHSSRFLYVSDDTARVQPDKIKKNWFVSSN